MIKKIMNHIGVGLAIGFVCTTVCLWIFGGYEASGFAVMRMFTVWLFASALYGLISMVYDMHIPFPINLIIHFLACLLTTFAASLISGIFEFIKWYEWFIYVLPSFIIIYVIIGLVSEIITRYQTKQINKKINHKKI